jgi:hypothetical protein
MTVGNAQVDLIDTWATVPDRLVLLVDEVRFGPHEVAQRGETVVFAIACLRAANLLPLLQALEQARDGFHKQKDRPRFKAKKVFKKPRIPAYQRHREVVCVAIAKCEYVLRFATTSGYLRRGPPSPVRLSDGSAIVGPEFSALQLFVKAAANHAGISTEFVDVIVDRSAQLGLDPGQHNLQQGQIQMYVAAPGSLNLTTAGTPAITQSPAGFRFIAVGEETKVLGDALLLPDAIAYLSRGPHTQTVLADARLATGVVPFTPVAGADFFEVGRTSP